MACEIVSQDRSLLLNNRQFSTLIDFSIEVAERLAKSEEQLFVIRMKELRDVFWPGRGIEIEEDFEDILQRKFWCRIFYEVSRAVYDRRVGLHEHSFWQSQFIYLAYATGLLFERSVNDTEADWEADTSDRREFDKIANGVARRE